MTTLEKLSRANRWRIKTGTMGSDETYGFNGAFLIPLEGLMWQIIIADGGGWRHLSITAAERRQLPSWTVLRRVKELFWDDEEWAVQYFPAKSAYINCHEFVLHIWSPLNEKLPTPHWVLV